MEIKFVDGPPIDPMDGDYLWFGAFVDGKAVKCCITFDVLTPRSNNPENAKLAFSRKKEQICATTRALIEAGHVVDGEVMVTRLKPGTPLEFPDVAPTVSFERDALIFPAIAGNEPLNCVVSFEVLIGFGSNDADEAVRVYQTQKADLHERVRMLLAAGHGPKDGELLITPLA